MRRLFLAALACLLSLAPSAQPTPTTTAPARDLVALTFDDGPSSQLTAAVLDILKVKGARATFCVQGNHAKALPALVRREVAEGHQLCDHAWSHPHFPAIAGDEPRQTGEVLATWRLLTYLAGGSGDPSHLPRLFRYPYGQPTAYADWWVGWSGMTRLRWDDQTVSFDWGCPGATTIVQRVMAGVRPGSVVLLHDGNDAVACGVGQVQGYLSVLIDRLRAAGYELGKPAPSATYSTINQSFVEVVPW
jgi:peptidoglycan/xylan/chitin deacetylase (PgdA/CDA1 family)